MPKKPEKAAPKKAAPKKTAKAASRKTANAAQPIAKAAPAEPSQLLSRRARVSNVKVSADGDHTKVEFDLGWDSSWRYPKRHEKAGSWDAAWVFVKFRATTSITLTERATAAKHDERGFPVEASIANMSALLKALEVGNRKQVLKGLANVTLPEPWTDLRAAIEQARQGRTLHGPALTITAEGDAVWTLEIVSQGSVLGGSEEAVSSYTLDYDESTRSIRLTSNAEDWRPGYLSPDAMTGVRQPAGAVVQPSKDCAGAFVYRSDTNTSETPAPVLFRGVTLRLPSIRKVMQASFAADGEVWVFAVEMVRVPDGAFSLGDPDGPDGPTSCFYDPRLAKERADDVTFKVTSEGPIQLGKELTYTRQTTDGMANCPQDPTGTVPAEWPKGYDAFYVMKYQVTQSEYAAFINTLPGHARTLRFAFGGQGGYRYTVYKTNNANGTRIATRPDRPANWISWSDGIAFTAWAGLRPMTELEYEKACRGPEPAVAGEYAWGTTEITQAMVIVGDENGTEAVSGNATYGNITLVGGDGGQGPVRDDGFAAPGKPNAEAIYPSGRARVDVTPNRVTMGTRDVRELTGASYWGVMALSGNLWDFVVSIKEAGLTFTGRHGKGRILPSGSANAEELLWPNDTAVGSGFRGGSWYTGKTQLQMADRTYGEGLDGYAARSHDSGFRCVRTDPEHEVLWEPAGGPLILLLAH